MKSMRVTWPYILIQGSMWAIFAVISNYASNFLYQYQFSDAQISLFLGINMILAFALQIGTAELISRNPKLKTHIVMYATGIIILLCLVGMLFGANIPILAVICFAITRILLQIFPALANSLGMEAIENGAPVIYGLARGSGSLFNGITAVIIGQLIGKQGITIMPVFSFGLTLLFVLSVYWFFRVTRCFETENPQPKAAVEKKKGFLKQYPRFTLFLIGGTFLCISQTLLNNFLFQIMLYKGGNETHQGLAGGIAAFVEIPVMFAFPYMLKWASSGKWVRLSSFFFLLKAVMTLVVKTPEAAVFAQGIQVLSYGLFAISSVIYAAEIVGKGEAVRAQSYLSTNLTLGMLAALSMGGTICQYLGVPAMIITSGAFAIAGGILLYIEAAKAKKQ